jgi:hypothetical protein
MLAGPAPLGQPAKWDLAPAPSTTIAPAPRLFGKFPLGLDPAAVCTGEGPAACGSGAPPAHPTHDPPAVRASPSAAASTAGWASGGPKRSSSSMPAAARRLRARPVCPQARANARANACTRSVNSPQGGGRHAEGGPPAGTCHQGQGAMAMEATGCGGRCEPRRLRMRLTGNIRLTAGRHALEPGRAAGFSRWPRRPPPPCAPRPAP